MRMEQEKDCIKNAEQSFKRYFRRNEYFLYIWKNGRMMIYMICMTTISLFQY